MHFKGRSITTAKWSLMVQGRTVQEVIAPSTPRARSSVVLLPWGGGGGGGAGSVPHLVADIELVAEAMYIVELKGLAPAYVDIEVAR